MMNRSKLSRQHAMQRLFIGYLLSLALSGCATFKTLEAKQPVYEKIFFYSGTRLNWATLTNNDVAIRKFNVTPPEYPLLDLPFSFALDSFFLPLSACAEIFH